MRRKGVFAAIALLVVFFVTLGSAQAGILNTWNDEAAFVAANPGLTM